VLLVIASLCLLGLLLLGLGDLYRVGGALTSDHLAGAAASFATRNGV
jgi:hypothetical protein